MDRKCSYCDAIVIKPETCSVKNWEDKKDVFCSRRCMSLMNVIDGKGYLGRYLEFKEIPKSELKEAMNEFGGIGYPEISKVCLGSNVSDKDLLLRITLALYRINPDMTWGEMIFDYRSMLPRISGKWYFGTPPRRVSRLASYMKDSDLDLCALIEENLKKYNHDTDEKGELIREPKSVKRLVDVLAEFAQDLDILYGDIKWRKGFNHLMAKTNSLDSKQAYAFGRFFKDVGINLDYRSLMEEVGPAKLRRNEILDKYRMRVI